MPLITHSALRAIPDDAKEFFVYTTPIAGISLLGVIGDTQTATIRFTQESHFAAIKLVATETGSQNYSVVLEPSEGDRRLTNDFVRVANLFGTAQLPMIMPQPRLFLANTVLTLRIQNREAVVNTVFLSFIGFKIFYDINQLDLTRRNM